MGDQDFDEHPDWGRYLVPPGSKIQPVGDPTRWGAGALTLLQTPGFSAQVESTQLIQAATMDGYSRSWAILGTLSLPEQLWGPAVASQAGLQISLEVVLGVGQIQVVHEILLFRNEAATAALCQGLCPAQYAVDNGGPYDRISTPSLSSVAGVRDYTYCFAAIGALIGATINLRAKYTAFSVPAGPPVAVFPTQSRVNVILTPFAAGHGL